VTSSPLLVVGDQVYVPGWETFGLVEEVAAGRVRPLVYRVRLLDRHLQPTKTVVTVGPNEVLEWNDPVDEVDDELPPVA
jgi:hypothetical protein